MITPQGDLGGTIEVWVDMESCQKRKQELRMQYDDYSKFACETITKEELENPKGRHENYEMEGA